MAGHADPREALIRAAFNVAQAVNAIAADRNSRLVQLFDDIAAEIARIDPSGPGARRWRDFRVQKLLDRVEELTGEAFSEWNTGVRSDMARLGRAEGLQVRADLVASLGEAGSAVKTFAPTQNMMKAILDTSVFGDIERGMETLEGWTGVQEQATLRRIRQQIQLGMTDEGSIDELVARVRGGRARGVTYKGVADLTRRQATTLVRTAAAHITAEARMLTFQENPRVVKAIQFVAALDSSTCLRCASLDGESWPLDSDAIVKPTVHLGCRCSLVSLQDWEALGLEPPDDGMRAARDGEGDLANRPRRSLRTKEARDRYRGADRPGRSKTRTTVPADTTYEDWLRDQKPHVVREILGPSRAKKFLDGGTPLDVMVGDEARILTLDELERRVGG